jgi:hypothetical protein
MLELHSDLIQLLSTSAKPVKQQVNEFIKCIVDIQQRMKSFSAIQQRSLALVESLGETRRLLSRHANIPLTQSTSYHKQLFARYSAKQAQYQDQLVAALFRLSAQERQLVESFHYDFIATTTGSTDDDDDDDDDDNVGGVVIRQQIAQWALIIWERMERSAVCHWQLLNSARSVLHSLAGESWLAAGGDKWEAFAAIIEGTYIHIKFWSLYICVCILDQLNRFKQLVMAATAG